MPKSRDRVPDPSPLPRCECGHVRPSVGGVLLAEHNVHHAEWQTPEIPAAVLRIVNAYRDLHTEDLKLRKRLNVRIVDLEEELGATQWDLKVAGDLIADLKADLDALNRLGSES